MVRHTDGLHSNTETLMTLLLDLLSYLTLGLLIIPGLIEFFMRSLTGLTP